MLVDISSHGLVELLSDLEGDRSGSGRGQAALQRLYVALHRWIRIAL
jgi:hypothetical protein